MIGRRIFVALLFAAVYVFALASLHPLDIAAGLLIGSALVVGLGRFLFGVEAVTGPPLHRRVAAFPLFAAAVIREITVGTWRVALVVVGLRPLKRPGIVAIPIGERSPTGVSATALAVTLSPGEVFVDLDRKRGQMYVHVLDASDPDAVREHYDRFYQRYQRAVFP